MSHYLRLAVVVVVFLGCFAGYGGLASAASGQAVDQAIASGALNDEISRVEIAARDRWPETFGGLWVDERGVLIAFSHGAQEKVLTLSKKFTRPDLLHAVDVPVSFDQLESLQMEMVRDRTKFQNSKGPESAFNNGKYNLDLDLEAGLVVVTVPKIDSRISEAFDNRYGHRVVVEEGTIGVPKACNSRKDCLWNLRAGLRTTPGIYGPCSTGFVVKSAIGRLNILSAAHCQGSDRWHGSPDLYNYGNVMGQQESGRVDAERHSVITTTGGYPFFNAIPSLYANNTYKKIAIRTRSNWAGLTVGTNACKSGAYSGKTCGKILSKTLAGWWLPNGNRFIKVRNCAIGGDSGSPLYDASNWHKAHGILSAGQDTLCPDPTQWNAYSHIEYVLNALGVTLVVAP